MTKCDVWVTALSVNERGSDNFLWTCFLTGQKSISVVECSVFSLLLSLTYLNTSTRENFHTLVWVSQFIFLNRIRSDVKEPYSKNSKEVSKIWGGFPRVLNFHFRSNNIWYLRKAIRAEQFTKEITILQLQFVLPLFLDTPSYVLLISIVISKVLIFFLLFSSNEKSSIFLVTHFRKESQILYRLMILRVNYINPLFLDTFMIMTYR